MRVEDRVFIYFRHTRRRLTFIPSYDLSTLGVPKKPLMRYDKRGEVIAGVLDYMVRVAHTPSVDKQALADLTRAHFVGRHDIVDIVHIAAGNRFGERILIRFKEGS